MSGNRTQQQSIEELSRSVDSLAMQIVMVDQDSGGFGASPSATPAGLTATLTGIKDQALSTGCGRTAAATADLLSALANATTGPDFEDWLSSGLVRLQEALEDERLSIASPPPASADGKEGRGARKVLTDRTACQSARLE